MKLVIALAAVALFGFAILEAPADAETDDFYEGKRLNIVVGASPGGGFDAYARLIARHLGKHIPGNPGVIVQNMPGAGGALAANYSYNVAKPDVSIVHFGGTSVLLDVLNDPAAKFDGRKFGYLGAPRSNSVVCFVSKEAGLRNVDDWMGSERPVIFGGVGSGSPTDDVPRFLHEAIGVPFELVSGYGGTSQVRAAIERGEVAGGCWDWGSLKITSFDDFESGRFIPLLQATTESHPDLKDVPLAIDYAKTDQARELLTFVAHAHNNIRRVFAVPPGTSPARLEILRKAFIDTLNDPALRAEAERARMDVSPIDGPAMAQLMAGLYALSPEAKAKVKEIVLP